MADDLENKDEVTQEMLRAGGFLIPVQRRADSPRAARQSPDIVERVSAPDQTEVVVQPEGFVREDKIFRRSERIYATLPGASAATAANYGVVFMAMAPCFVREVHEFHTTAGSDAGSVGLNLEKLSGTTALDSGSAILSSNLNLKGTANTRQQGTLVTSRAARTLLKGDRLALKDSGTLTAVAGVIVIIEVEYI